MRPCATSLLHTWEQRQLAPCDKRLRPTALPAHALLLSACLLQLTRSQLPLPLLSPAIPITSPPCPCSRPHRTSPALPTPALACTACRPVPTPGQLRPQQRPAAGPGQEVPRHGAGLRQQPAQAAGAWGCAAAAQLGGASCTLIVPWACGTSACHARAARASRARHAVCTP